MQFTPHQIIELNGSKFEVRPNLMCDDNVYLLPIDGENTCQEMCNSPFKNTHYTLTVQVYKKDLLMKAIQIEPKVQDEIDRLSDIDEPMRYESPENSEF